MSTTLKRRSLTVLGMVLLAAFLGVTFNRVSAANPAPVMVFHLTEPEDDMLDAMNVINSAANSPMVIPVAVTVQSGEVLTIFFEKTKKGFAGIYLEGGTKVVYEGNLWEEAYR